jgi:GH25 family lysozyme M1 (1,4-beta-N-acetylmuramidase)
LGSGYTFAYAKATEGVGYTDSKYLSYAVNGVAAGMKMGAYHFARPDLNPTNAGAIAEANYFLSVAQPYIVSCQLPPSLDLEGSYLTTSFTSAQLTAWVQNWMTTVETATGIKPVLYIGASTVSFLNSSLNTYPLWRDELTGSPSPATNLGVWTTWAFNQYSWTGTVPGIAGSQTDLDFFNGNTMAAFNTFMGCSVATDLQQNTMNAALVIYPNPTTGLFTIETNSTDLLAMDLYDVNGRLVFSKAISDKSNIDVTMLDEGFYTMTLKSVDRVITKKLVIVR